MKTLIGIPTCWVYQYDDPGAAHTNGVNEARANAIRQTWYKDWLKVRDHIDLKFFYGKPSTAAPTTKFDSDSIILDCPDDYPNLPCKVRKMFEWALDEGYDYLVKVDDDVHVNIPRLLEDAPAEYKGWSNGWFISGAAYWINRRAMQCVLMEPWNKEITTYEDQHIGKCLERYGILPQHDERYHVCPCDDCLKKVNRSKLITQLTSTPKMMFDLHNATV